MSSSEISTKEVPEIYVTQSVSECKANQDLAKKSSTNPTIPTSIEGDHHNIDVTKVNQKTRINKSLPNKNETVMNITLHLIIEFRSSSNYVRLIFFFTDIF